MASRYDKVESRGLLKLKGFVWDRVLSHERVCMSHDLRSQNKILSKNFANDSIADTNGTLLNHKTK